MNEEYEGYTVPGFDVPPSPYSTYVMRGSQKRSHSLSRRTQEVIVFCSLAFLGGGLLSVVLVARVDYFYPYMFFLVVSFVAWNRYFQLGRRKRSKSTAAISVGSLVGHPSKIKIGD